MKEQETLLLAVTPGKHSQLNPNDKDKIFLGIADGQVLTAFFSPSHFATDAYITPKRYRMEHCQVA